LRYPLRPCGLRRMWKVLIPSILQKPIIVTLIPFATFSLFHTRSSTPFPSFSSLVYSIPIRLALHPFPLYLHPNLPSLYSHVPPHLRPPQSSVRTGRSRQECAASGPGVGGSEVEQDDSGAFDSPASFSLSFQVRRGFDRRLLPTRRSGSRQTTRRRCFSLRSLRSLCSDGCCSAEFLSRTRASSSFSLSLEFTNRYHSDNLDFPRLPPSPCSIPRQLPSSENKQPPHAPHLRPLPPPPFLPLPSYPPSVRLRQRANRPLRRAQCEGSGGCEEGSKDGEGVGAFSFSSPSLEFVGGDSDGTGSRSDSPESSRRMPSSPHFVSLLSNLVN
jgi:hypothetical protein